MQQAQNIISDFNRMDQQIQLVQMNINTDLYLQLIAKFIQERPKKQFKNIVVIVRNFHELDVTFQRLKQLNVSVSPLLHHQQCRQLCRHIQVNTTESTYHHSSVEAFQKYCAENDICASEISFQSCATADIIVVQHELVLDPKFSLIKAFTDSSSVIIFQNCLIQDCCTEALSMHLNYQIFSNCNNELKVLLEQVKNISDPLPNPVQSILNAPVTQNLIKRKLFSKSVITSASFNQQLTPKLLIMQLLNVVDYFTLLFEKILTKNNKIVTKEIDRLNKIIKEKEIQYNSAKNIDMNADEDQREASLKLEKELQIYIDDLLSEIKVQENLLTYPPQSHFPCPEEIVKELVQDHNCSLEVLQNCVQLIHSCIKLIEKPISQDVIQLLQFIQLVSTYSNPEVPYAIKTNIEISLQQYYKEGAFQLILTSSCPYSTQKENNQQDTKQNQQNIKALKHNQILYQVGKQIQGTSTLQYICCEPIIALRPVLEYFNTIYLVQSQQFGELHQKLQKFVERQHLNLSMNIIKQQNNLTKKYIIAKGADQSLLSSKTDILNQFSTVQNYAKLIQTLSEQVQDGIIVAFPSYNFLQKFVYMLQVCKLLTSLTAQKLLFIDSNDPIEQTHIQDNFKLACDIGRGAVLCVVANSKFTQQLDFRKNYCRLLIIIGIPYNYIQSAQTQADLFYQKACLINVEKYQLQQAKQTVEYLTDKVGSELDRGVVIYADERFSILFQNETTQNKVLIGEMGVERDVGKFMVGK
ncbi:TFIIH_basal transcription factor complex helicase subunit [Hexamita inflata]|uniref:TFIIH basal transcription factor complex helicase subunit n=1 Tax=Hexamita inflata TaxID=28002 RepID=A0AA86VT56_9EUKA|nr:TFIIH basal transcription factor complex helicase subunit [Hexamita inflata]